MMKPNGLRWLPAMLLVLILFPAFATHANAQGLAGDIVEIQWGGHPTKARIDHCRSEGCDRPSGMPVRLSDPTARSGRLQAKFAD